MAQLSPLLWGTTAVHVRALTILTFLDAIDFGSLLLLSVMNGMLKGLDMPVRHTIVTETVDGRGDWSNAIALNSVMLSSSLVLGPAIGGILIASVGVKYCFLYDTLSYIAAIVTLKAMQVQTKPQSVTDRIDNTCQKLKDSSMSSEKLTLSFVTCHQNLALGPEICHTFAERISTKYLPIYRRFRFPFQKKAQKLVLIFD